MTYDVTLRNSDCENFTVGKCNETKIFSLFANNEIQSESEIDGVEEINGFERLRVGTTENLIDLYNFLGEVLEKEGVEFDAE
jgi:hypothetical protein